MNILCDENVFVSRAEQTASHPTFSLALGRESISYVSSLFEIINSGIPENRKIITNHPG